VIGAWSWSLTSI